MVAAPAFTAAGLMAFNAATFEVAAIVVKAVAMEATPGVMGVTAMAAAVLCPPLG